MKKIIATIGLFLSLAAASYGAVPPPIQSTPFTTNKLGGTIDVLGTTFNNGTFSGTHSGVTSNSFGTSKLNPGQIFPTIPIVTDANTLTNTLGYITPQQYANGSPDGVTDNYLAFQQALNDSANKGLLFYVPPPVDTNKFYVISKTLMVTNLYMPIIDGGWAGLANNLVGNRSMPIHFTGTGNFMTITNSINGAGFYLKNLQVYCANRASVGIWQGGSTGGALSCNLFNLENIHIVNCYTGFVFRALGNSNFKNVKSESYWNYDVGADSAQNYSLNFEHCDGTGINGVTSNTFTLYGGTVRLSDMDINTYAGGRSGLIINGPNQLVIENVNMENYTTNGWANICASNVLASGATIRVIGGRSTGAANVYSGPMAEIGNGVDFTVSGGSHYGAANAAGANIVSWIPSSSFENISYIGSGGPLYITNRTTNLKYLMPLTAPNGLSAKGVSGASASTGENAAIVLRGGKNAVGSSVALNFNIYGDAEDGGSVISFFPPWASAFGTVIGLAPNIDAVNGVHTNAFYVDFRGNSFATNDLNVNRDIHFNGKITGPGTTGISLYALSGPSANAGENVALTVRGGKNTTASTVAINSSVYGDADDGGSITFGDPPTASLHGSRITLAPNIDATTGVHTNAFYVEFNGTAHSTGGVIVDGGVFSGNLSLGTNMASTNILGTIGVNNARAGFIGEYVESLIPTGSKVALGNAGTVANVTSISLTAGDWDVEGQVSFIAGVGSASQKAGISTTSATLPTDGSEHTSLTTSTLSDDTATLSRKRINVSSTTTVYLVASESYSSGNGYGYGFINARRVR